MRKTKFSRNLQIILAYSLIVLSCVTLVYALGFMTNFYKLFVDGTSEMYDFFKDLQILNNVVFNASIIFILLSLGLVAFDITKRRVGIFGAAYTIIVAVFISLNTLNIYRVIEYFENEYTKIDFSVLEGYTVNMLPFNAGRVLFISSTVLSIVLSIITFIGFMHKSKEDKQRG